MGENLQHFEMNEVIIKEGDDAEVIYLIKEGYVNVIKQVQPDEERIIALLGPGDTFGELGIILRKNRQATVVAKTDVQLEVINSELFNTLFESELGEKLEPVLRSMAERINISGLKLAELGSGIVSDNIDVDCQSIELIADSESAIRLLQGKESVRVTKFPFRVGRLSKKKSESLFHRNDLYLVESEPFVLALSHFVISQENGKFVFTDRSDIGSIINGEKIGGLDEANPKKVELKSGENKLILGKEHYNISFKIMI